MTNNNQDSPFNLVHLEEYRKQKATTESDLAIRCAVITSPFSSRWEILLVAETPTGRYSGSELIDPDWPFLRWRMNRAKRRLLKQWRIVCEMES